MIGLQRQKTSRRRDPPPLQKAPRSPLFCQIHHPGFKADSQICIEHFENSTHNGSEAGDVGVCTTFADYFGVRRSDPVCASPFRSIARDCIADHRLSSICSKFFGKPNGAKPAPTQQTTLSFSTKPKAPKKTSEDAPDAEDGPSEVKAALKEVDEGSAKENAEPKGK